MSLALREYFTTHPAHEVAELGVTAAAAQSVAEALRSANESVSAGEEDAAKKRIVRDAKLAAARKRLNSLYKELSIRLEPLEPRWRRFGFNLPGAATVPEIPGARLQIACAPSAYATSYRFYLQRPIIDPEPLHVGTASDPLFVTESLVAAQPYVVYVSAVNGGAESELSEPVTATPVLSAAA